jgi:hypothetical protein
MAEIRIEVAWDGHVTGAFGTSVAGRVRTTTIAFLDFSGLLSDSFAEEPQPILIPFPLRVPARISSVANQRFQGKIFDSAKIVPEWVDLAENKLWHTGNALDLLLVGG